MRIKIPAEIQFIHEMNVSIPWGDIDDNDHVTISMQLWA